MNVLVIGDGHTYGYGLPAGQLSYIGHFIRLISRTKRSVSVEAYAHLTLPAVLATLARLPLGQYDLIILQLDYTAALQDRHQRTFCAEAPVLPTLGFQFGKKKQSCQNRKSLLEETRDAVRKFGLTSLVRSRREAAAINTLLEQLRPYRHNVMLLTPFPHREPVNGWLRKRSRQLLLRKAGDQLVSVFDVSSVVAPREEYFLTDNNEYLNAVSHELIGQALFDFYQSAPTIVTIQTIRRDS